MAIEITFADNIALERRLDTIYYPFRVSNEQSSRTVMQGITGQAKLWSNLSPEGLIKVATEWLRFCIDNRRYDPFNHPEVCSPEDVTAQIMDHWLQHHSFSQLATQK
jgi:hypothetical protein